MSITNITPREIELLDEVKRLRESNETLREHNSLLKDKLWLKSYMRIGGRCGKHPLQTMPCETCARDQEFISKGACPACEGEGEQGGQFTGGTWTCYSCEGTGKLSTVREENAKPN